MTVDIRKRQMNSDLNHLYQHIHSSPSVVVDIPKDIGAGRIIRTVSPSGTVISSWKMQYGKDTAVKGEVKDNFRLLFCLGDGAAWVSDRKTMGIDRNEACLMRYRWQRTCRRQEFVYKADCCPTVWWGN